MLAALMEFNNYLVKAKTTPVVQTAVWTEAVRALILLLAPPAPHLAEELWERLGHAHSLAYEPWPQYDDELAREKQIELAVQVNGKVKDRIVVAAEADEESIRAVALANEKVVATLAGKTPRKVIVIKSRLVNIVV